MTQSINNIIQEQYQSIIKQNYHFIPFIFIFDEINIFYDNLIAYPYLLNFNNKAQQFDKIINKTQQIFKTNKQLQVYILWIINNICQQHMEPERSDFNPRGWRIFHSVNYVFGSIAFLLGSLLLFPYFSTIFDSALISAWLYTVGSFTFTVADFTEWTHYEKKVLCNKNVECCRWPSLSFNFFISLTGSFIYLIGSALFIPSINKLEIGLQLFIAGSACIIISQTWKVVRVLMDGYQRKKVCHTIQEDTNGFLIDILSGIGGACYFTGSFLFFNPSPKFQIIASTVFSCGGFFFYLSGAFMINRYFLSNKKYQGAVSIQTSESKFDQNQENIKSESDNQSK